MLIDAYHHVAKGSGCMASRPENLVQSKVTVLDIANFRNNQHESSSLLS